MNQTAHISLQKPSISNSVETKMTVCALTCSARPACIISVFSLASRCRVARLAPRWCISAPPVRGYLRIQPQTRNPFFRETSYFFHLSRKSFIFKTLDMCLMTLLSQTSVASCLLGKRLPHQRRYIWGYPQTYPQESADSLANHAMNRPVESPESPMTRVIQSLEALDFPKITRFEAADACSTLREVPPNQAPLPNKAAVPAGIPSTASRNARHPGELPHM